MQAEPVQTGFQYAPVQSALLQDFLIAPSLPRHRLPVVHTIRVPDKKGMDYSMTNCNRTDSPEGNSNTTPYSPLENAKESSLRA